MSRPALFLDRDGVINVDRGYVSSIADFEPVEGVFDALREAQARGYALIIVTNQSGIGRGYFSQEDYDVLERHVEALFAAEGVALTATYHCPHHPGAACECRKPAPGMILRAARQHDIDLSRSAMIGDKPTDVQAAQAAGVAIAELIGRPRDLNTTICSLPTVNSN